MVGYRAVDIFAEAGCSSDGYIEVDFLTGDTSGGSVSKNLRYAILAYRDSLPDRGPENGVDLSQVRTIKIRFGTRPALGRRMRVSVEDSSGRTSDDWYYGCPARRPRPEPGKHISRSAASRV